MSGDTLYNTNFKASAALTRGYGFELDTTNNYPYVIPASADTTFVIGVAIADAAAEEMVQAILTCSPVTTINVSGGVTEGTFLCNDGSNDGQFKTASSGDHICALAMETASGTGNIRAVLFSGWLKA